MSQNNLSSNNELLKFDFDAWRSSADGSIDSTTLRAGLAFQQMILSPRAFRNRAKILLPGDELECIIKQLRSHFESENGGSLAQISAAVELPAHLVSLMLEAYPDRIPVRHVPGWGDDSMTIIRNWL